MLTGQGEREVSSTWSLSLKVVTPLFAESSGQQAQGKLAIENFMGNRSAAVGPALFLKYSFHFQI